MEQLNKFWLEKFRKEKGYVPNYISQISEFLRFRGFENKPFDTFITEEVLNYTAKLKKAGYGVIRRNAVVSVDSSFKRFLSDEYP